MAASFSRRVARALRRRAGRVRRVARRSLRLRPELSVVIAPGPAAEVTRSALAAQTARPRRFQVVSDDAAGAPVRADRVVVLPAGDVPGPGFVTALLDVAETVPAETVVLAASDVVDGLRSLRGVVLPAALAAAAPMGRSSAEQRFWLAETITAGGHRLVLCPDAAYPPVTEPADETVEQALDEIARLDALPRSHPQQVVRAVVGAATAPLNRALHADPGLRPVLLERVAGVADFDYTQLNRDLARDLAVVYAALPRADTSANIAARRVREFGVLVDVVSADLHRKRGTDTSAEPLWEQWLDARVEVGGRGTVQGDWTAITRFVRDGLAFVAGQEERKGDYRSVYSRTMFPAAHLLAAAYKLDHPDTPWLAEFSDPQLLNPRGETRRSEGEPDLDLLDRLRAAIAARGLTPPAGDNVWEWAETAAYALADTVMFTNEQQRDFMLDYCAETAVADRARDHAVVSHHPSPPPELYNAADPDYPLEAGLVHLAYFGAFYLTRTLTELIEALAMLAPEVRGRLRLHVFTTKPEVLRQDAIAAGVSDVVVANAYAPFLDYLALTTRFDVLVVNDYDTSDLAGANPFLPAKYSDYRAAGTAVWGIVEPGSVLSRLPLAYRSRLDDVAGAADVLKRLVDR